MHWIERIYYYFKGRYGRFDELTKFLIVSGFILLALATIFSTSILSYMGVALISYGMLRPASKEIPNRQKELASYMKAKRKFQEITGKVTGTFNRKPRNKTSKRRLNKVRPSTSSLNKVIIECPNCGQKLRAPRGKTLKITCQSCEFQFKQRT